MQKREQEASVLQHIYNAMNLAYQHMCWNTFQGWAFQEMKAAADMTLCRIIAIQSTPKAVIVRKFQPSWVVAQEKPLQMGKTLLIQHSPH